MHINFNKGQQWDTNPFEIAEVGDKLYGRGTCDMKGFIAICMAFAKDFSTAKLKIPIHMAFSFDEEVGAAGVHPMTNYIAKLDIKPKCCFVGEPTMMKVVAKHKGYQSFKINIRGFECHSSLVHQGVNAVEYASEIISKLRVSIQDIYNKYLLQIVVDFFCLHFSTLFFLITYF